jgi:hypothetical protein
MTKDEKIKEVEKEVIKLFYELRKDLNELESKYEISLPVVNWNKITSEYLEQL